MVIGTGFPESTDVGRITFDGNSVAIMSTGVGTIEEGSVTTDETGVFQVRMVIPSATTGVKQVGTDKVFAKTKGSFEVQKKLTIVSPDSAEGRSGETLSLKGTGFAASETRILRFNGVSITSTDHRLGPDGGGQVLSSSDQVQADSRGSFQVKFTMPPLPS